MERTDLEFEFFLAQKLGRTVQELRQSLTAHEYMQWGVFYRRKADKQQLQNDLARAGG